jgi:hypothetical protein
VYWTLPYLLRRKTEISLTRAVSSLERTNLKNWWATRREGYTTDGSGEMDAGPGVEEHPEHGARDNLAARLLRRLDLALDLFAEECLGLAGAVVWLVVVALPFCASRWGNGLRKSAEPLRTSGGGGGVVRPAAAGVDRGLCASHVSRPYACPKPW